MRKQFDIKFRPQIESGEYKVETRDGKKVRVLCYDANNAAPIVALIKYNDGSEASRDYYLNGTMDYYRENPLDLFIVTPEEELTEFEKELENFYNHHLRVCSYDNQGTVEDSLHDGASKLLILARKELEPEIKAEALKDLPRWKKDKSFETEGTFIGVKGREFFLVKDGYSISVAELLRNFPGFKEDKK